MNAPIGTKEWLRSEADELERLDTVLGATENDPYIAGLRAAAERIEGLERLTHYFPRNNGHPNAGSEVDRLREIIADLDKRWMTALKERNALRGENADLRATLQHIVKYWNRDENERAMANALWHIIVTAEDALDTSQEDDK